MSEPGPMRQDGPAHGSLKSYTQCLRNNPAFKWLWIAACIDTMGSWIKCAGGWGLCGALCASGFRCGSGPSCAGPHPSWALPALEPIPSFHGLSLPSPLLPNDLLSTHTIHTGFHLAATSRSWTSSAISRAGRAWQLPQWSSSTSCPPCSSPRWPAWWLTGVGKKGG